MFLSIRKDVRKEKLQEIEDNKKKLFNEAKEAAFAALRAEQGTAIQALGQVWQAAEDNNYTVPN
ncbi:hypothetical protein D4R86_00435 [bacterium]|nr:MAG: hypothetical protein D4R86_00435 [bacterium]